MVEREERGPQRCLQSWEQKPVFSHLHLFPSSVSALSPLTHQADRQLDIYANSLGKAGRINADTQSKRMQF